MIRLALRVERKDAELALANLLELAPGGVEELDAGGETVEYAVYGAPGELPQLPALRAAIGAALVEVQTSELADDWQERWKRFHRPVCVMAPPGAGGLRGLRVRPPWEDARPAQGIAEIVIDPGQAFGTGAHATTKLCLQLLIELAAGGARAPVIDVGTGSGVLAIAAAKLGFEEVYAFDHDSASVQAARQNAAANGVKIEVARRDLRAGRLEAASGAIVLANLLRPLLIELAAALPAPPAQLIAGGLLRAEAQEVAAKLAARHGLQERKRHMEGEWAALWLVGAV